MQRAALADHRDDIGRRRRENEREAAVCATGEAGQRVHRARMEIEDAPAPPREGRGAARAGEYGRTAGSASAAALLQRFKSASQTRAAGNASLLKSYWVSPHRRNGLGQWRKCWNHRQGTSNARAGGGR